MIKKQVVIDGITYTVSATTESGAKKGIQMLKKSLKQIKKQDENNG